MYLKEFKQKVEDSFSLLTVIAMEREKRMVK